MEQIRMIVNDGGVAFDEFMAQNRQSDLPEGGDLTVALKPNATISGQTGVMFTFTVVDKGIRRRVQAVTTMNVAVALARVLIAKHEG